MERKRSNVIRDIIKAEKSILKRIKHKQLVWNGSTRQWKKLMTTKNTRMGAPRKKEEGTIKEQLEGWN